MFGLMDKPDTSSGFHAATQAVFRALARRNTLDETHDNKTADKPRNVLRGESDARAMRLRHHRTSLERRNTHMDLSARAALEALEQARCEALGAREMSGVAQNLHAALEEHCRKAGYNQAVPEHHDSAIADALYVLARVTLSGEDVPENARPLFESWTPWLDERLGPEGLQRLTPVLNDQEGFAVLAQEILARLGMETGGADGRSPENGEQPSEDSDNGQGAADQAQDQQSTQEQTAENGLQDKDSGPADDPDSMESGTTDGAAMDEFTQAGGEGQSGEGGAEAAGPSQNRRPDSLRSGPGGHYRIYTAAFDEVVRAEELADPQELERLRRLLDRQMQHLHNMASRLANRLQRKLMTRQQRSWKFDMEEGYIDAQRLAGMIANPTVTSSFKQESETDFRDTVVTLLIDNSGSMRGRPIAIAAICADIVTKALERCGIKVEILGFTTRAWKGGTARDLWIEQGRPPHPGRLNDLRHIIYKEADAPVRRARKNIALMLKEGILKENIDGEALVWAHNRLARRPETRKILIVISDGAPVDDSTLSVNPSNILEEDLHNVIAWIEGLRQVELTAIGIGHDVGRYYRRAVTIADAEDLAQALAERLERLLNLDKRKRRSLTRTR